jgi:hypothetical protein
MQGFNSGTKLATVDMLASLRNYLAGTILTETAGLAVVGAVINYARKRPFMPLVFSALAFLSVTALWNSCQCERAKKSARHTMPSYGKRAIHRWQSSMGRSPRPRDIKRKDEEAADSGC